jgi:hypothetical protein
MTDVDPEVTDWFWDIIERADRSQEKLRRLLMELSRAEIERFQKEFVEAAIVFGEPPYIDFVDPDETEDDVETIGHWIVSQGKTRFIEILDNPELMPKHVDFRDPEILNGVAYGVYGDRFGEELDIF